MAVLLDADCQAFDNGGVRAPLSLSLSVEDDRIDCVKSYTGLYPQTAYSMAKHMAVLLDADCQAFDIGEVRA